MLNKFAQYVSNNDISNDCLVQFIELAGSYLNVSAMCSLGIKSTALSNYKKVN